MVWFQCEDCGENLKKPKLPNHFRICSAFKLSCIDCGEIFSKESVQSHSQCMTEAEKYGPKDQGKPSLNGHSKPEKPKKNVDVDINVGLSSRPPWFCSLCNTPATSKQTLLLHADGKKHRAKAKAFHASQKQSNQNDVNKDNGQESAITSHKAQPDKVTGFDVDEPKGKNVPKGGSEQLPEKKSEKKRKHYTGAGSRIATGVDGNNACHVSTREVVQAEEKEEKSQLKRNKNAEELPDSEFVNGQVGHGKALKNIKWKELVISTLKSNPDGVLKIKRLQKLVMKELKVSGVTEDEMQLCDAMMKKVQLRSFLPSASCFARYCRLMTDMPCRLIQALDLSSTTSSFDWHQRLINPSLGRVSSFRP